jgi:RNA polymerase sigma-70 factor (ECF subfamily)
VKARTDWTAEQDREFQLRIETELPRLLGLARRLTQNDQDAHDIVQDALERGWKSRTKLRDQNAAGAWLRSIVARRAVDLHRSRAGQTIDIADQLESLLIPDIEDPEALIAAAEDSAAIRASLRSLSTADRIAVVLHDGEGWPAQDIADLLQIGVEAAHKRIQRARTRLLSALAEGRTATHEPSETCHSARERAHELLDNNIGNGERVQLQKHLDTCLACPASLQAAAALLTHLSAPADDPGVLADEIRARLLELVLDANP